jgi:hypothetical protein
MAKKHTAENMAQVFLQTLEEFQIKDRVRSPSSLLPYRASANLLRIRRSWVLAPMEQRI